MKGSTRYLITFTAFMLMMTISAVGNSNRYSTIRLANLAEASGLHTVIDTLADSCYYGDLKWGNYPISVRIKKGEVTHLGINLFSMAHRNVLMDSPVCDFLERYLLEHYTLGDKTSSGLDRNKTERVNVCVGELEELYTLSKDTTLCFSLSLKDGRSYTVTWANQDKEVFNMNFPASNKLLCGYTLDEDAEQLRHKIKNTETSLRKFKGPNFENLIPCDSIQGEYFIEKGTFNILPIINNDRYYTKNDSIIEILHSPEYPVESLANLLISGEIENDYAADVRMLRYEMKIDEFIVPLNSLINFFLEEGCVPFFGLKGIYPSKNKITALFEMVNHTNGYEHLMSVEYDTTTLPLKKGVINIRLTPYLPTYDIESFY